MGYIRTVTSILKQLGKTDSLAPRGYMEGMREINPKAKELFSLLEGITKIPKEEFGRFDKLMFQDLQGNAGVYRPGSRDIAIDPGQSKDYKKTFLHELEHGRQFSPDAHEMDDMKALVAHSNITDYKYKPIEKLARNVSALASPSPHHFSQYHNMMMYSPEIRDSVGFGTKLLDAVARNTSYYEPDQILQDILNIRKYSGKGWLYGGAGVGMARTGEE